MTEKKRSVATDALKTLGTIIDNNAGRDAIHLAVNPEVAGTVLKPGQHVGRNWQGHFVPVTGKSSYTSAAKALGIVDPFLKEDVKVGERFWFILYPNQVDSLRHVWSHPEFKDEAADKRVKELEEKVEELQDEISEISCCA